MLLEEEHVTVLLTCRAATEEQPQAHQRSANQANATRTGSVITHLDAYFNGIKLAACSSSSRADRGTSPISAGVGLVVRVNEFMDGLRETKPRVLDVKVASGPGILPPGAFL
jgi:hypothetical protein